MINYIHHDNAYRPVLRLKLLNMFNWMSKKVGIIQPTCIN
jgi:hypothetical protein